MLKKFTNETRVEGYVFDHKLEIKMTGPKAKHPNTQYIAGIVNIATDESCENVVPVHFTYITELDNNGKPDSRWRVLKQIIDTDNSVVKVGKDNALKVRVDSAIGLNEYFTDVNEEKPRSFVRNEGGFIHIVQSLNEDESTHNTFKVDMLVTRVKEVEANPDRQIDEHIVLHGCIFNFKKELLPIDLTVSSKGGMNYFRMQDISAKKPLLTQVWGKQISRTLRTKTVNESAFGEDEVVITETSTRDFVVTGCRKNPYLFGDENTLTETELQGLMSDRELYLADMKAKYVEYMKAKKSSNSVSTIATANVNLGGYDF